MMSGSALTRADFLRGIGGAFVELSSARGAPTAARPNILAIVTDDQGYADLSAYRHAAPDVRTPNMDRIAAGGVLFTSGYVNVPVCTPSRTGWNTGRYPQRWDPEMGWRPGLPANVRTLAEYLKSAGYATGKVGKNDYGRGQHSQGAREYPLNHGYDEFLGFSSNQHDYFRLSAEIEKQAPDRGGRHTEALLPLFENRGFRSFEGGYTTEIFTDWAIRFLEKHRRQPFLLHVSYNSIHHLVHEVPGKYLEKFGVKPIPNYDPRTMGKYFDYYEKYGQLGAITDRDMRLYYLANLNCLDDNIGRLLDALERLGLAGNTLTVLFADNGGAPEGGGNNRPLRGSKYTVFEGGIRVPFVMRWPKGLPAGKTYPYRVSTLDLLPTFLEAAGIPAGDSARLDGASFLPAVRSGKASPTESRPLFWAFRERWAVIDGDWKLMLNPGSPANPTSQVLTAGDPARQKPALFNLKIDPSEQRDVSKQHPGVVARLARLREEWLREVRADNRKS
ncbi:MAG: sulfatase-like hydrolase/transferase [Acidobacteria bacterium]|nr:sulfatase-like hydrolase/transferase [Acidobacteriota bacterium]